MWLPACGEQNRQAKFPVMQTAQGSKQCHPYGQEAGRGYPGVRGYRVGSEGGLEWAAHSPFILKLSREIKHGETHGEDGASSRGKYFAGPQTRGNLKIKCLIYNRQYAMQK